MTQRMRQALARVEALSIDGRVRFSTVVLDIPDLVASLALLPRGLLREVRGWPRSLEFTPAGHAALEEQRARARVQARLRPRFGHVWLPRGIHYAERRDHDG